MKKLKDWFENAQYALIFAIILLIIVFVFSLPFQIGEFFERKFVQFDVVRTFVVLIALILPLVHQVYIKLKGYPTTFISDRISEDYDIKFGSEYYNDSSLSKLKFLKRYILRLLLDYFVMMTVGLAMIYFLYIFSLLFFELWTLFFPSITLEKFINHFF